MATLDFTIRTDQIGEALVDLAKTSTAGLAAKVVQLGFVDRLALVDPLSEYLPGIYIQPVGTVPEIYGVGGRVRVDEEFRVAYALSSEDNTLAEWSTIAAGLRSIATTFSGDATLSALASTIGNDQIEVSQPLGIDWDPQEEQVLSVLGIAVKVVVMRWGVRWLAK